MYHNEGKAELWLPCDEHAWFDGKGVYAKFTDKKTNAEKWYQRMMGGERGCHAVSDDAPTPPPSRKPTPEQRLELEDQERLALEDATSAH